MRCLLGILQQVALELATTFAVASLLEIAFELTILALVLVHIIQTLHLERRFIILFGQILSFRLRSEQ